MAEMVGRASERRAIREFVSTVARGARALVIDGEPGIGKSRLFEHAIEIAQSDATTLVARPVKAESRLANAALSDLLAPIVDDFIDQLPLPQREAIDAALLRADRARPVRMQALCAAVLTTLRLQALRGPTLIAVDDLQWLDRSSQSVLAFALHRLRTEPIALLAVVRGEPGLEDCPLVDSMPADRLARLRLGPLSERELHIIVQRKLGEHLPSVTLRRIYEASGGNPYYALQLASALSGAAPETSAGEPLPLPPTLDALLAEQLDHLPATAMSIVAAASVVARPTAEMLVTMSGGTDAARAALNRVIKAGLLKRDGDRLRFMHPLLGEAAYSRQAPEERRHLHGRAAEVVDDVVEKAWHLALAATGPEERVAASAELAAGVARSRGAPLGSAELFELAASLTPCDRPADRLQRMVDAGVSYIDAGDTDRATDLLECAVEQSTPGPQRAEARRELAVASAMEEKWHLAMELLLQASEEAETGSHLRAQLAIDLAQASIVLGDIPAALVHGQDALAMVGRPGTKDLQAMAVAATAFCSFLLGHGLDRASLDLAVTAQESSQRSWRFLISPRSTAAITYKYADEFEVARGLLNGELERVRAAAEERELATLLYHLAELECWSGNLDAAAAHANELEEVVSLPGQTGLRILSLYASGLVASCRGLAREAIAKAQECRDLGMRSGNIPIMQLAISVLGHVALAGGDARAAHIHLAPLGDSIRAFGLAEPGVVRYLPDEVEALIGLGRLAEARSLLDPFEERARALQRISALAMGARCRGLLLAAEGKVDEALSAIDESLSWHGKVHMPLELGRTLLVQGEILRRARRRRAAAETLQRAACVFTELGAEMWANKARAECARASGRQAPRGQLTASERRMAELVAAGLSNKEIAARLFVSVNTVQTTLSHSFRKLSVRSRSELAARVATAAGARFERSPI